MRRLPVFLLLDVSDSMVGEPHHHLQQGLERLAKSLRQDPHALETVYLSVIAFAGRAKTLAPLIDLPTFYSPRLPIGSGTSLGLALTHLMAEIDRQVVPTTVTRRGDWKPIVYLLTDGKPTDHYQAAIRRWQRDYANRATLI
ncbi:MAG: VWA domain-containing protein, partial [Methylococcales bacterium]